METIRIRGARTHNLKNVSLDLPRNRLVVITGLSGSGKSSLAFDTLYAEGQRRYVESLSAYARQFLQLMEKPDVDLIEGLSPAIAIEQKATSATTRARPSAPSPRSTTTCACSSRASATRTAPSTTSRCRRRASRRWSTTCWRCRRTRADDPRAARRRAARASRPSSSTSCARRASCGCASTARCTRSTSCRKLDQEQEAHDRGRGRPAEGRARRTPAAKQRLAESFETALRHADGRAHRGRDRQRARNTSSRRSSPARSAATRSPSSSRASSRSTTRWAPARAATAWARSRSSIPSAWSPSRTCRSPAARSAAGTGATSSTSRCSRRLAQHYGFDVEAPFETLPEQARRRSC